VPPRLAFLLRALQDTVRVLFQLDGVTCDDLPMTGRRPLTRGYEFSVTDSEYADGMGVIFASRVHLEKITLLLIQHCLTSRFPRDSSCLRWTALSSLASSWPVIATMAVMLAAQLRRQARHLRACAGACSHPATSPRAKRVVYTTVILSVLLCGCE